MKLCVTTLPLLLALSNILSVNAYKGEPVYRLNTNIRPESYTVVLKPYLLVSDGPHRFTVDGEVFITIRVRGENVSEITLNAHQIEIKGASLSDNGINAGRLIQTFSNADLNYDETAQKLTLKLEKELTPNGLYLLHLEYIGQIRNDQKGFFHVNYTDSSGKEKCVGLTQAQPINARMIFPCFDEPSFRAHFTLEMSRPANYNTVFNTALMETTTDGEERFWDRFASSPAMPTYLFAFILSEFVSHGTDTYKIVTRVEHENKTDFAYKVGERATKAFSEYFQIPYKKSISYMQLAAAPNFPYNGMENWGLMIYKEHVLVHEPGYTDDWSNKQFTLSIIFHEIAHMWFGNSVTYNWWNHFWLSEAFARYFEYFMAHKLYYEYELADQFVVNEMHLALSLDASRSTQPLTSPDEEIQAPSEIGYKFNTIIYTKGACIIRMMATIMTQPNFDKAIRDYLKEFLYKSTTPADLFKHIESNWLTATPIDLDQFFYDWTEQVGYPVLFVNASVEGVVTLTQKRFLYDSGDGSNRSLTYAIPISYATDHERDFSSYNFPRFYFWKVDNMTISFDKPFKWIIFNLFQSNYYRVFYDRTTLFNIKAALMEPHHSEIPAANRAQLIDDLFNFARVSMVDYETVFQFLEYLANETDYLPWHATFTNLPRVTQRLTRQQQKDFAEFLNVTMVKVYTHLGFTLTNLTILDTYNRNEVISWACKYHLFDCDKRAQLLFDKFKKSGTKPAPDFRETFYCSATREGTFAYYQTLKNRFDDEKLVSEKKKIVRAMGCTGHLYEYHFDKIISGLIPKEYAVDAITSMYTQNPDNVRSIFIMLTNSIEKVAEVVGGYSNAANLISDIANYLTTHEQKKLLEDFVKTNGTLFESSVPKLHHAIYVVHTNLKWAETRLSRLIKYLNKSNAASISSVTAFSFIAISLSHGLFYTCC
uniref:Aminopeptidase n=1 Tax=Bactrocera dorsalis TaxID=27457 RepID=A0A034WMQ0_BACDO